MCYNGSGAYIHPMFANERICKEADKLITVAKQNKDIMEKHYDNSNRHRQ